MIDGLRIGHDTNGPGRTGCTVIVPPAGSVASAEVRGLAPGTREIAVLEPYATVARIDAIVLTGGSALGLATADGVAHALRERGIGFATPAGVVPIVPAAVIFDLAVGDPVAPDAAAGRRALEAALAAASGSMPRRGAVGAGAGATVGSLGGGVPAGIGIAVLSLPGGASIAAIAVVNAFGDVVAADGTILAGVEGGTVARLLRDGIETPPIGQATTLVCVVTDATTDKLGCYRLARAAHAGIARATSPAATAFDGDTAFAVSTRARAGPDVVVLEAAAAEVVAAAIRDAVAR